MKVSQRCEHWTTQLHTIKKEDFPGGSERKESACSAGDLAQEDRSPGEGNVNPLQYSYLENSMDRGAWQATVHGVAKSRTWLSDYTFIFTEFLGCFSSSHQIFQHEFLSSKLVQANSLLLHQPPLTHAVWDKHLLNSYCWSLTPLDAQHTA